MKATILQGDVMERMRELPDASVDSVVTDPPYHLTTGKKGGSGEASVNLESPYGRARVTTGFMGMTWDGGDIAHRVDMWAECLRVLKPGGHLLSFGGSRTYHRMACAIEDAGFEIRDQIMWIYGSGFPKSMNIGDGLGTALKPAHEPIVMARKPFKGTVAANVAQYGTGALNVDACRIPTTDSLDGSHKPPFSFKGENSRPFHANYRPGEASAQRRYIEGGGTDFAMIPGPRGGSPSGRWPANVIHDGSDEVVECFPEEAGAAAPVTVRNGDKFRTAYGAFAGNTDEQGSTFHNDTGSAARFFYCAKASREERNRGCYDVDAKPLLWSSGDKNPGSFQAAGTNRSAENNHPTVKPVDLMRYLVRLVTPKGGIVLDPFTGSGSTGIAALEEEMDFLGIENKSDYVSIAHRRIATVSPLLNTVEVMFQEAAS